jgi:tetratricopeptide (TPR) repeat protein
LFRKYRTNKKLLNSIKSSEESTFFTLSSKVTFNNYRFEEALKHCQAYNERRPNQSPANYQLMGDCYTKLGKSGKAIKAYRKAEEVAAQYGGKPLDLSAKIGRLEMFSEYKKEERSARNLAKKK